MERRKWLEMAAIPGLLALALALLACDRRPQPSGKPVATPSIASMSPAATDLLLAMDAGNHLAAVSTCDPEREGLRGLPRVGDYETIDWEQLHTVRPQAMIVQMHPERMPAGLKQRADKLGTRLVNIQIETVDDIFGVITTLGATCGEPAKAEALARRLRSQFDAVKGRVVNREPVPTLLVVSSDGKSIVGPNTFMDDLLTMAGGRNVAGGLQVRYPAIDREMMLSLNPEVVVQFLPDASEQVREQARQFWKSLPQLPAVRNGRVYELTDWYVLLPGSHVGEVAGKLADLLHRGTP